MAHTASTGSAKRTVDVIGKRLGIKKFGGEFVKPGAIIVRQRGSQFYPGENTAQGKDFTIFALTEGFVSFRRMTGYKRNQKYIDVLQSKTGESKVVEAKAPVAEKKPVTKKPVKTATKSSSPKKTASKSKAAKAK
jgi:large subunit ribosomal protein L27